MWASLINQVFNISLGTHSRLWHTEAPPRRLYPFYFARAFFRKALVLMIAVFLISRINSIINLKPFNFYLGGIGEGLLMGYPLFNPARDFLFTLGELVG